MLYRFLLTGLLAVTLASAQRGGGGGGGGGDDMGGGMPGGMGGPSMPRVTNRIDIIAENLKLDKDQKKNVKSILDATQKDAKPLHEQIVKSRMAIGAAVQAGKSQEEIKQLVDSQAALEVQMAAMELNAFAKIFTSLGPEQRSQTRSLFMMMKGLFDNKNWNSMQ
jgi:hypothetical protein